MEGIWSPRGRSAAGGTYLFPGMGGIEKKRRDTGWLPGGRESFLGPQCCSALSMDRMASLSVMMTDNEMEVQKSIDERRTFGRRYQ